MKLQPYFLRLGISLLALVGTCVYFSQSLKTIFLSNPGLNAFIIVLTFAGIFFAFYQLNRLKMDAEILSSLKRDRWDPASFERTSFLEPVLQLFEKKNTTMTPSLAKKLVDSLADRLENERVFPRYLIGLLVFLGLLGTFWGLSQTIASIAKLIQNMPNAGGDSADFFALLKQNLQSPLEGMGTAFGSSLFGLGGSLFIGLLELQVGHAYGRFFNETDAYLTACTREEQEGALGQGAPLGFLKALLTHNIEAVDKLTQVTEKSERNQQQQIVMLDKLIQSLTLIAEQNKTQDYLMRKLAEGQSLLSADGLNEETLKSLQNIDHLLSQSLQYQRDDREEFLRKLRDELRLIAHTMANVAEQKMAG